jgi:cation diffusion facilitator family transporter
MDRDELFAQNSSRASEAIKITFKGFLYNTLLVIIKIVAGILGRSAAMVADGFHSLTDSVSDIFLILGFRLVSKPPDKTHRYGHGKFETLLTAVIGLMIIFAGFLIFGGSSYQIYSFIYRHHQLETPGFIALIAAMLSIFVKEILYRITKKKGLKLQSDALIANAWHHRSDALTSVATLVGIGGAILLGEKWVVLDPLAALLVSVFILVIGIKLLVKSVMELMEASIGEDKERQIIETINSVNGALNPHNLKTRKVGNNIVIDVHIEVGQNLNVVRAHDIATNVEEKLRSEFGHNTQISVHIEPFKISR